jgi:hypothetical protein
LALHWSIGFIFGGPYHLRLATLPKLDARDCTAMPDLLVRGGGNSALYATRVRAWSLSPAWTR